MKDEPTGRLWYERGVHFSCRATGRCCWNHGEFTHVYVGPVEVKRLARHLGLAVATFKKRYTEHVDGFRALLSRGDACIFLEEGRCAVYDARPEQCATWPFWKENLEDPATWERDIAPLCAGIGQGRLYSRREMDELAERAARALDEAEE